MRYQEIPPFYEYPHVRGDLCDCLDCKEDSIAEAIAEAAKRRPHGTIKVKLKYRKPSKPMPIEDWDGQA